MRNENTFSSTPDGAEETVPVVVWGTGNMGRAAIRAVTAHPGLTLAAVIVASPAKVGLDAGELAGLDARLGVAATADVAAALAALEGGGAVAYMASGDTRPAEAVADIASALSGGAVVVTPALYALYDPRNAPAELREPLLAAARAGGSALFVSGVDPGWGNDLLPVLVSSLAGTIDQVRCQEIFDYATYDAPDAVRFLVGMGEPMDYEPPMVAPGVPTMVWGGQVRMIARALGVELDEIRETLERRALDTEVTNAMGTFVRGSQGALRFEVQGIVDGEPAIVVEHVTRITPGVAPDWPVPPDGGDGTHRVVIEGRPRIEVSLEATDEFVDGVGNRAAGGNATAANRLVNAIAWLRSAEPGLYDGLDVPLSPPIGRLGRTTTKVTR
ncbi:MAG TPA: dihydrodipicolinate reductase [Nocardioides sp.]|uniref:NAD(P)H-dependent amine dehydrogenase family protein n=1 Tax=Nocardioides sp. TaxID=35761 RepID=UPI002D184B90|nr:dihydrodipicolinate reductase [Nocardioides sp.]HTW13605.1 dihydrodipicolinate reductase [Nocardioides sp.]